MWICFGGALLMAGFGVLNVWFGFRLFVVSLGSVVGWWRVFGFS